MGLEMCHDGGWMNWQVGSLPSWDESQPGRKVGRIKKVERHDGFNRIRAKKRCRCGDRNTKKRTRRDEQMIRAEKTGIRRLMKKRREEMRRREKEKENGRRERD
jgi:hypothetical protein